MVSTGRWGDVTMPYATAEGSSQPDFGDIAALVEKFQDGVGAVTKSQAQLQPNIVDPTAPVDFRDIAADIDAFTGTAYPYTGPCVCPSTVLCGAAACDTEVDCADGGRCVDGFCTDACGRCTQ